MLILVLHAKERPKNPLQALWKHGLSNPLILACALGFALHLLDLAIPLMARRSLEALGNLALPLALIGLGAGLEIAGLKGKLRFSVIASLLNVALSPLLGYFVGRRLGLDPVSLKISVLFLACPTAIFSYALADILDNDSATARNIVILSTLFSIVSLVVCVALV